MTKEELSEIRKRAEQVPGGPWILGSEGLYSVDYEDLLCLYLDRHDIPTIDATKEVRAFISAARQDVLALVDEVEKLQEEHAKTKGILGTILTDIDRAKAEGRCYV